MVNVDKNELRNILTTEGNFKNLDVDLFLQNFPDQLHDEVGQAYSQWLKDRSISTLPIQGLIIEDVMKKRHAHFLQVIRDLEILFDESKDQEKRDILKATLQKMVHFE